MYVRFPRQHGYICADIMESLLTVAQMVLGTRRRKCCCESRSLGTLIFMLICVALPPPLISPSFVIGHDVSAMFACRLMEVTRDGMDDDFHHEGELAKTADGHGRSGFFLTLFSLLCLPMSLSTIVHMKYANLLANRLQLTVRLYVSYTGKAGLQNVNISVMAPEGQLICAIMLLNGHSGLRRSKLAQLLHTVFMNCVLRHCLSQPKLSSRQTW